MRQSKKALIDFWVGNGKVRRERSVPNDPGSRYRYFFQHELVGDLELSVSWEEFFKMFNSVNHACFLKEIAGEVVENPFDPWRHPGFVGMSIRILPHTRQDYQLIHVFDTEIR